MTMSWPSSRTKRCTATAIDNHHCAALVKPEKLSSNHNLFVAQAERDVNMKSALIPLLLIASASAELRGTKSSSSTSTNIAASLHHRQDQAQPTPRITGFRWINTITNKPYAPDGPGSELLVISQNDNVLDLGEAPAGVSIEALTEGTDTVKIGSIQFMFDSLGDVTTTVDNDSRFYLCGNNGTDVLPCDLDGKPSRLVATAYSEKNGKGQVLSELAVILLLYQRSPPSLKLTLINPTAPMGKTESPLTNGMTVNLATTPTMSVRLDHEGYKHWEPQSVVFNYDNRTIVHTENYAPFALLGNTSPDNYTTFAPKVGRHKVVATAYSRKYGKGQSSKISVTFKVVKGV